MVSEIPCSEVLVCSPDAVIKHLPEAGLFWPVVPGSVLPLWECHTAGAPGAGPTATTVSGENKERMRTPALFTFSPPLSRENGRIHNEGGSCHILTCSYS